LLLQPPQTPAPARQLVAAITMKKPPLASIVMLKPFFSFLVSFAESPAIMDVNSIGYLNLLTSFLTPIPPSLGALALCHTQRG